jgi:hypothetical protein
MLVHLTEEAAADGRTFNRGAARARSASETQGPGWHQPPLLRADRFLLCAVRPEQALGALAQAGSASASGISTWPTSGWWSSSRAATASRYGSGGSVRDRFPLLA